MKRLALIALACILLVLLVTPAATMAQPPIPDVGNGYNVQTRAPRPDWTPIVADWYHVPATAFPSKAALASVPGVLAVETDVAVSIPPGEAVAAVEATDPLLAQQYQLAKVQAQAAWQAAGSRGAGVKIAILDTGVYCGHEDLQGHCTGDADDHGHGTHVAGIAAATYDNGKGGAGLAPAAQIVSVKVLDANGSGSMSGIAAGLTKAADNGAAVASMSLGCVGDRCASQMMQDAVAYARGKGTVVIAAAGNHGTSVPSYPGYYALSVAATDQGDRLASFSAFGAWIDVAAPGVSIVSTLKGGGYGEMSGTSMATPVVSGLAALVKASCPACTVDQIEARLRKGVPVNTTFPVGPRVDALAAVTGDAPPPGPTRTPVPTATPSPPSNADAEIVRLLNEERKANGLQPLTAVASLTAAAHAHNDAMNKCALQNGWTDSCLRHEVPGEAPYCDRFTGAGFPCGGEIIAQGYTSPGGVVQGWMGSPGHRGIILDPRYTVVGCAADDFANGNYQGLIYTCDFSYGAAGPGPTATPTKPVSDAPRWDAGTRYVPFRLLDVPLANQQVLGLVHEWAFVFDPSYNTASPGFLFKDAKGNMTPGNTDQGAVSVDIVGGFLWSRSMDQKLYKVENLTGLKAQWGTLAWR